MKGTEGRPLGPESCEQSETCVLVAKAENEAGCDGVEGRDDLAREQGKTLLQRT